MSSRMFKIGDVVQLKSGYIDMTVVEVGIVTTKITTKTGARKTVEDVVVSCVWQDPSAGKLYKSKFPANALKHMHDEVVKKELTEAIPEANGRITETPAPKEESK